MQSPSEVSAMSSIDQKREKNKFSASIVPAQNNGAVHTGAICTLAEPDPAVVQMAPAGAQTDLRSAMTCKSLSAFADRVSSSVEQRNFDDTVTTSANQWTSTDELKNPFPPEEDEDAEPLRTLLAAEPSKYLRPFLFAIIVVLTIVCASLLNTVPEAPRNLLPALRAADANVLSCYDLVFLTDRSESMKNTFDCPLGKEFSGILTSRVDWIDRQLKNLNAQFVSRNVGQFSVISFEDKVPTDKKAKATQAGMAFGILQAAAMRRHPERPLAIIVLTDKDPANLGAEEQKILSQSIESANRLAANPKLIFQLVGNDYSRLSWSASQNSGESELTKVPFFKVTKTGLPRNLARALR